MSTQQSTCFCCLDDLSNGLNTLGPLCLWQCLLFACFIPTFSHSEIILRIHWANFASLNPENQVVRSANNLLLETFKQPFTNSSSFSSPSLSMSSWLNTIFALFSAVSWHEEIVKEFFTQFAPTYWYLSNDISCVSWGTNLKGDCERSNVDSKVHGKGFLWYSLHLKLLLKRWSLIKRKTRAITFEIPSIS